MKLFVGATKFEQKQIFAIKEIIESILRLTSHLEAKHKVPVQIEGDTNIAVNGSKSHLVQVLINLITNAYQAIEPICTQRSPEIKIKISLSDNQVKISVQDNGVGILQENQHRVFEPFYTTREVGQGMGLGLSVSHGIVQALGSELKVKSQVNEGTEFWFELTTL